MWKKTENQDQHDYLLHLELDGAAELISLNLHVLAVSDLGGELSHLVQTGSKKTWDLLDQGIGSQESIVLLA